jgi:hypothetical protein
MDGVAAPPEPGVEGDAIGTAMTEGNSGGSRRTALTFSHHTLCTMAQRACSVRAGVTWLSMFETCSSFMALGRSARAIDAPPAATSRALRSSA